MEPTVGMTYYYQDEVMDNEILTEILCEDVYRDTQEVLLLFKGIGKNNMLPYREIHSLMNWDDSLNITDTKIPIYRSLRHGKQYKYTPYSCTPFDVIYLAFDAEDYTLYFQNVETTGVFYRDLYEVELSQFEEVNETIYEKSKAK